MPIHLIRHAGTGRELAAIEAPTYARAVEWALRRGMSLMDAAMAGCDLRGAFLAGADLRYAVMVGCDLRGAYLRRASLFGADLREARLSDAILPGADLRLAGLRDADLSRADLRHASLVGADLRGSILVNAKLDGAILDWRWSEVPIEVLRRLRHGSAYTPAIARLALAGDERPWAWLETLRTCGGALGVLSRFVRPGDNAPAELRRYAGGRA